MLLPGELLPCSPNERLTPGRKTAELDEQQQRGLGVLLSNGKDSEPTTLSI
jgi:hypothetical protein